jgi:hypothetical protein
MERMNDRGQYGHASRGAAIGAAPTTDPSPQGFSWGALGFFGLVGAGLIYLVRPHYREVKELERSVRATAREVGLKKGMTVGEQSRAWDAYYKKHGYPEDLPSRFRNDIPERYRSR